MTTPQPLLVAAAIRPMRGRRVFGKQSKALRHLWLTPDHVRTDPRYATFRAVDALCGWHQGRTTRDAQGEVTSAAAVAREVVMEASRPLPLPALGMRRDMRDAAMRIGICVSCALRLLFPACKHSDCSESPDLALACMVSERACGEAANR